MGKKYYCVKLHIVIFLLVTCSFAAFSQNKRFQGERLGYAIKQHGTV